MVIDKNIRELVFSWNEGIQPQRGYNCTFLLEKMNLLLSSSCALLFLKTSLILRRASLGVIHSVLLNHHSYFVTREPLAEWLDQISQFLQGIHSKRCREWVPTKCVLTDSLISKAVSTLRAFSYLQGFLWMLAFFFTNKRGEMLCFLKIF